MQPIIGSALSNSLFRLYDSRPALILTFLSLQGNLGLGSPYGTLSKVIRAAALIGGLSLAQNCTLTATLKGYQIKLTLEGVIAMVALSAIYQALSALYTWSTKR